ncbi:MAG: TetR/AcrR family transcriptional regulator [Ktedonobacteraceae bacterium]|nr:TetR/AcrR family transcriptional regulator [Ktedonobacteraceae bacterium]MBO0790256.1 TetR/AcrR family transcriptional regulator [Ktedonobacteraceae bacterium]
MGIKQRRTREKQEVRQGILTAAREIAQQDGWQAVTIRKVAERIEYSPPTIYEYFDSKEKILFTLYCDGFAQLAEALRGAINAETDYEERILKMGEAYWEFARRNPELYQVMNGMNGVPLNCDEKPHDLESAFTLAVGALNDWAESKGIVLHDVEGAVDMLRSFLHGLVALVMVDDIMGGEQRARQLLRRGFRDMLTAWSVQKAD